MSVQKFATVAQLVEQLTRNEQVARSNRVSSSKTASRLWGGFPFVSTDILLGFAQSTTSRDGVADRDRSVRRWCVFWWDGEGFIPEYRPPPCVQTNSHFSAAAPVNTGAA